MKRPLRGERVKFLNETGSGVITRVIDKEMVMVRTDDGFEYPVMISELIITSPDESREKGMEKVSDKDSAEPIPADKGTELDNNIKSSSAEITDGPLEVLFAMAPRYLEEPVTGEADLYLINDSPYNILYNCAIRISGNIYKTISSGDLEGETKIFMGTYHVDDLFSNKREIIIKGIPYASGSYSGRMIFARAIKPAREFLTSKSSYGENDYLDEDSYIVKLDDKYAEDESADIKDYSNIGEDLKPKDMPFEKPVVEKMIREKKTEEVDLHIEEILDNTAGMSPGEIINVQLARFRTSLEGAIKAKQKKVVYIHGSGAGKLKHEIRRIIDREYSVCSYQDASFREYGYGATLVIIK